MLGDFVLSSNEVIDQSSLNNNCCSGTGGMTTDGDANAHHAPPHARRVPLLPILVPPPPLADTLPPYALNIIARGYNNNLFRPCRLSQ